jgi:RNA polymerase sigma factor (TIGR02999 family)
MDYPSQNNRSANRGDDDDGKAVLDELMPGYYAELRRLARVHLAAERPNHTLQVTGLVNEAYVRLAGQFNVDWSSRMRVLQLASHMMRRILVDYARGRNAHKRGDGSQFELLDRDLDLIDTGRIGIQPLDEALTRLAELDERQATIVEMRFFAGLGVDETASALGISPATVKREWKSARMWLARELASV